MLKFNITKEFSAYGTEARYQVRFLLVYLRQTL